MGCKVAPAFYAVIIIGVLAVALHIVGYSATGWVVMSRKFTVEEIKVTTDMVIQEALRMSEFDTDEDSPEEDGQLIDNGGLPVPDDMPDLDPVEGRPDPEGTPEPGNHRPHPRPGHHGHGHRRHHHHHQEVIEETTSVKRWIEESVVEIEHVYVRLELGIWRSKLCMSAKLENLENGEDDQMMDGDSSSSSSDSSDHHKHRCHCKRMSTECGLTLSTMFVDMPEVMEIEAEDHKPWYKYNPKYFLGNTCLTEHRVEATIGLVMLVIAVLAGILAFRKTDACRCWSFTCLICLLVAFVMISIPVHRVLRHNYHHVKENLHSSKMHLPYALLSSLVSCAAIFILAIVVAVGICRRKKWGKQWARFDNDTDSLSGEKKGMPPTLVFHPEPLSGKAGLYDIWGDVKPVEAVEPEPEKKPLE